jgi:predicted esterase
MGEPKVFVSHGTLDRVLPVSASRHAIVPMFEMDGYAIQYHEFEGTHEMPHEVISSAMRWFLG